MEISLEAFFNKKLFFLPIQIVLEALPKDETNQGRRYRGYVAVDNLVFETGDVSKIKLLVYSNIHILENSL